MIVAALTTGISELLTTWGTVLGLVVVGILGEINARRAKRDAKKAQKVAAEAKTATDSVATELVSSNKKRDESLAKIHLLVNGAMLVMLKKYMFVTQRLAASTKQPPDIEEAKNAEAAYENHLAKQELIDQLARQAVEASYLNLTEQMVSNLPLQAQNPSEVRAKQ